MTVQLNLPDDLEQRLLAGKILLDARDTGPEVCGERRGGSQANESGGQQVLLQFHLRHSQSGIPRTNIRAAGIRYVLNGFVS